MGLHEAQNAYEAAKAAGTVIAMELLAASQALEMQQDLRTSPLLKQAFERIREVSEFVQKDRSLHEDVNRLTQVVLSGELADLAQVELNVLEDPHIFDEGNVSENTSDI